MATTGASSAAGKLRAYLVVSGLLPSGHVGAFNSLLRLLPAKLCLPLYSFMLSVPVLPDHLTMPFLLKAIAATKSTSLFQPVHAHVLQFGLISDLFVSNALVHAHASAGHITCARKLFDEMLVRDVVTWNSIICGYGQYGMFSMVLNLFRKMTGDQVRADKVTMVRVLSACTKLRDWQQADLVVKYAEENGVEIDVYLGNTMIDCYGRRGMVAEAEAVFAGMKEKNAVSMNAMLATYAKSGALLAARRLFDSMPEKDLVTWSSMIAGYAQWNQFPDALALFRQMQVSGVKADEVVIASVISACGHMGALELGRWIHDYIHRNGIAEDIHIRNALIDMYCKCGCVPEARGIFQAMKVKDTPSWNSIILGLANNGFAEDALEMFNAAMRTEGFQPNSVTFLGVLAACSQGHMVGTGMRHFNNMEPVHGIQPEMKHYGCVVDMLCRSGELNKALEFIASMPVKPDPVIWRTVLAACKAHGEVALAEMVARELRAADPRNSGNYVLMGHTYASASRWTDALRVRKAMTAREVRRKSPGSSLMDSYDIKSCRRK